MEFTKAQQLVVDALQEGQILGDNDLHPATAKSLVGNGVIKKVGDHYVLTDEYVDKLEPEVEEEPEEEVWDTNEIKRILMIQLGYPMKIQADSRGTLVELGEGSMHPVISYHEELVGGRFPKRIKWYTCLHIPSKTTFLLNGAQHRIIEREEKDS